MNTQAMRKRSLEAATANLSDYAARSQVLASLLTDDCLVEMLKPETVDDLMRVNVDVAEITSDAAKMLIEEQST